MIKKLFILAGFLILGWIIFGLIYGDVTFNIFWSKVVSNNQVKIDNLKCYQSWNSRAGYCIFWFFREVRG